MRLKNSRELQNSVAHGTGESPARFSNKTPEAGKRGTPGQQASHATNNGVTKINLIDLLNDMNASQPS